MKIEISDIAAEILPSGYVVAYFRPTYEEAKQWTLLLTMLSRDLITSISLRDIKRKDVFIVSKDHLEKRAKSRQKAPLPRSSYPFSVQGHAILEEGVYKLAVSNQQLEEWLRFYLLYLRDGFGAVNHIDFEVPCEMLDGSYTKIFLELSVDTSSLPMSEAEN